MGYPGDVNDTSGDAEHALLRIPYFLIKDGGGYSTGDLSIVFDGGDNREHSFSIFNTLGYKAELVNAAASFSECVASLSGLFREFLSSNAKLYGIRGLNVSLSALSNWCLEAFVVCQGGSVERAIVASKSLESFSVLERCICDTQAIVDEIREYEFARQMAWRFWIDTEYAIGEPVKKLDRYGNTGLHVCEHDAELISCLIASGGDVNGKNDWGETPLHLHAQDKDCCDVLLAHGADPAIQNRWGLRAIDIVKENSVFVADNLDFILLRVGSDRTAISGWSAAGKYLNRQLCDAIKRADDHEIEKLLGFGFELLFPGDEDLEYDAFLHPICAAMRWDNLSVVEAIRCRNPADTSRCLKGAFVIDEISNSMRSYALSHCAVLETVRQFYSVFKSCLSNAEVIAYFSRVGQDVNMPPRLSPGKHLLHAAVFWGLIERVEMLLSIGADPNKIDSDGNSAHSILDYDIYSRGVREQLRGALECAVLLGANDRTNDSDGLGL